METSETPTPNTPFNVFITGATDAVGREVTRQLSTRGSRVTGLTRGAYGARTVREDGGIPAFGDPLRAGELRSLMLAAEADVAMHLATQVYNAVPMRATDWDEAADTLTRSTAAFLEAAKAKGVKFVVYASYAFLYGDTQGEWVDETAPRLRPSKYGNHPALRAAIEAEDLVLNSGLPACILRAGFVYGPYGQGNLALREAIQQGKPLVVNEGRQYSNWIYAADLASAAILAAQKQPAGEIFNVVDNAPLPAVEFLDHVAAVFGVQKAARIPTGRIPGFPARQTTSEMQHILWDMSLRAKNDKAKAQLGWTPRYPTYREGIEQTLLAWRAEAARP
jgi:nucleoside-diphosphate-sugar epimerase